MGRIWPSIIRLFLKPAALADSTYSCSRTAITWLLVNLAKLGQLTIAKAMTIFFWLAPRAAIIAMAMMRNGNDNIISVILISRESSQPPK